MFQFLVSVLTTFLHVSKCNIVVLMWLQHYFSLLSLLFRSPPSSCTYSVQLRHLTSLHPLLDSSSHLLGSSQSKGHPGSSLALPPQTSSLRSHVWRSTESLLPLSGGSTEVEGRAGQRPESRTGPQQGKSVFDQETREGRRQRRLHVHLEI